MPSTAIIFIIDDDASVRRALGRVMASADFDCASFESGDQFLATADFKNQSGCIVADMAMLGMNGLELKHYLNQNQFGPPLIYLTAFDTREMRNAARVVGAVAFFPQARGFPCTAGCHRLGPSITVCHEAGFINHDLRLL